jgi:hypothetical protein
LQGFDTSQTPTKLAIDNLVMTLVPEPSALALLMAGGALLVIHRLKTGAQQAERAPLS